MSDDECSGECVLVEKCIEDIPDKICGDGCLSCDDGVCSKCEEDYYLSGNECIHCPNSCKTCSSENVCESCDTEAGLILDSGKCVSCFEKFPGCKECNSEKCIKCLDFFKTDKEGKCDTSKEAEKPTFKPIGLGRFYRIENRKTIYFRLYLRVSFGMMYNCKIKFTLVVTRRTRSLEEIYTKDGTCEQTGTVTCFENGNPTVAGCTGMLDCKADLESDDATYSKLHATNFKLEEVNNQNMNDEDVDANGLSEELLDQQTGPKFEDDDSDLYVFNQSGRSSCKCKNGIARLKLKGSVNGYKELPINKEYSFNTTDGETASCTLDKKEDSSDATLKCNVPTSSKEFNFTKYDSSNTVGGTNSLVALETNTGTSLCEVEDGNDKNSSSSGLSAGAIVGIVIVCVVVMIAVGAIIAYYAVPFKKAGMAAAAAVNQPDQTSSQTGFVVSPVTTTTNSNFVA